MDIMSESVKNPAAATMLLSSIAEVDGREFTKLGVRMFAAALDDMKLSDAMTIAAAWL